MEARKDGLCTTTTSGFDITKFRFIKVISLPVMSDFQADRPVTDVAQGWVANAPILVPRDLPP